MFTQSKLRRLAVIIALVGLCRPALAINPASLGVLSHWTRQVRLRPRSAKTNGDATYGNMIILKVPAKSSKRVSTHKVAKKQRFSFKWLKGQLKRLLSESKPEEELVGLVPQELLAKNGSHIAEVLGLREEWLPLEASKTRSPVLEAEGLAVIPLGGEGPAGENLMDTLETFDLPPSPPGTGEEVFVAGWLPPVNGFPPLFNVEATQVGSQRTDAGLIVINAAVSKLMRGGLVTDRHGHVIGVPYADHHGKGLVKVLSPRWLDVLGGRPVLTPGFAHEAQQGGLRVKQVADGSPEQTAGLQPGDLITAYTSPHLQHGGRPRATTAGLSEAYALVAPGEKLAVQVSRRTNGADKAKSFWLEIPFVDSSR